MLVDGGAPGYGDGSEPCFFALVDGQHRHTERCGGQLWDTAGLHRRAVSGYSRSPLPPARTMASAVPPVEREEPIRSPAGTDPNEQRGFGITESTAHLLTSLVPFVDSPFRPSLTRKSPATEDEDDNFSQVPQEEKVTASRPASPGEYLKRPEGLASQRL